MSEITVGDVLARTQRLVLDRLDAQLLILHALGQPIHSRAWLIAHDTDTITSEQLETLHRNLQRRLQGEPIAYITGHKEFFGLDLHVDPRVLVPRPDTETLAQWALDVLVGRENPTAIDLGTGSGAIALALKHTLPALHMEALDFSSDALDVARANARRLQLAVQFTQSDWLERAEGQYDLIVSNPPYIEADDPHLEALTFEPPQALASGADGLDDIRTIATQARRHLKPGGWLLLEHGYNQAAAVRKVLQDAGFGDVQSRKDLADIERCTGGWIGR